MLISGVADRARQARRGRRGAVMAFILDRGNVVILVPKCSGISYLHEAINRFVFRLAYVAGEIEA